MVTSASKTAAAVQGLDPSHFERAVQTMVSAFAKDPMTAYLFPRLARRERGLQAMLRVALRQGLWHGQVDTAEGDGAVAVWLHSERSRVSVARALRLGYIGAGMQMGWGSSRRVLRFLRFIEEIRRLAMPRPHWYLLTLAVAPERQVRGLGTTLLRHGIARARAQGLGCYLETTRNRNVAFYEKHGFRVAHEAPSPNGGPVVWSMRAIPT